MQITNANFPIGTFSHSFGVETYIRKDIVFDGESLIKALLLYMNEQVKIYNELFNCELLVEYAERIKNKKSYGNPAVAFALLAMHLKIDLKTALYTHLYSTVAALTQNCVRAIPLGQVKGQKIIYQLKHVYFDDIVNKVFTLDFKTDFCKNIPGLEIAQMEHEDTPVRLFMS
nr:urease accessory protein UreF [Ureaplasma parvum]